MGVHTNAARGDCATTTRLESDINSLLSWRLSTTTKVAAIPSSNCSTPVRLFLWHMCRPHDWTAQTKERRLPNWQPFSIVDGRLITGQNPASSTGAAQKLLKLVTAEKAATA
jgi:hypothetical protein